jgi:hypothetical protein
MSARFAPRDTRGIVLVATARSSTALHPLLNTSHIFDENVDIKAPSQVARKEVNSSFISSFFVYPTFHLDAFRMCLPKDITDDKATELKRELYLSHNSDRGLFGG